MVLKLLCGICVCEKLIANNYQAINCNKYGLWTHIKCNKINKQIYIVLNDKEFKQKVIGKQIKFTLIAKLAISNGENFIKAVNSENNITKYIFGQINLSAIILPEA